MKQSILSTLLAGALMVSEASLAAVAAETTSSTAASGRPAVPSYLVPRHLPADLQAHLRAGRFREAEAAIDQLLTDAATSPETSASLGQERERLRRLRRDYSLTEDKLREKLRRSLPEAGDDHFARWRDAGGFQQLVIDGEVRYFNREPSNLLLFHPEARALKEAADAREKGERTTAPVSAGADPSGRSTRSFDAEQYIRRALTAAREQGTTEVLPVRFQVRHTITVKPDAVPAGTTLRCWMPIATEYGRQSGAADLQTTPSTASPAPVTAPQRTVYLQQTAEAGKPTVFEARWTYRSAAFAPAIDPEIVRPVDASDPALQPHLREGTDHVLFTPEIRKLAAELVGTTETNPYRKAERIYSWIQKNVRWCAEMEYSTLPNIVEKVSTERRGDCGTQALLFVTLCRASGVPARWQSGWVTRPGRGGWNLHDWAEFHVEPYGWLPADPSLAGRFRDAKDEDLRLFFLGHTDGYRMIANTDYGAQFDPAKKHWRSDPVDNQRGEVEWDGGNLYYDQWAYDVEVESEEE